MHRLRIFVVGAACVGSSDWYHLLSTVFLLLLSSGGKELPTQFVENIPLQRLGSRRDIADAVLFLASGASSLVTANTVIVDGASWLTTTAASIAAAKATSKL